MPLVVSSGHTGTDGAVELSREAEALGADALMVFSQYKEKIAVVLMDMLMPVMDGPAAIRALQAQHPQLRFIATSGLMQNDKIKERLGNTDIPFLAKPYATEKLLQNLRKLIQSRPDFLSFDERIATAGATHDSVRAN